LKLDIGAATHGLPGFKTVGLDAESKADYPWDLWNLPLPFKDNTIEEIHASHLIEHFPKSHGLALLKDFHRILIEDAKANIFVPNLTNSATLLLIFRLLRKDHIPSQGNFYGTNSYWEDPDSRSKYYFYKLHKYGYFSSSLKEVCKSGGFDTVKVTTGSHWSRVVGIPEYSRFNMGWFISKVIKPELRATCVK